MPSEMLKTAVRAAYGEAAVKDYQFRKEENTLQKEAGHKLVKVKKTTPRTKLDTK